MKACMVCEHPERASIEDARLRNVPCNKIAQQYSLSPSAVWRHSQHLGRSVVVTAGTPLIDRVEALMTRLESISAKAQTAKEWHAAVAAMKEVRCSLELVAKLTGQLVSTGGRLTVGVAVNVSSGAPRNAVSDHDLDLQIAASVREATNDFDSRTIERMKRLLDRYAPLDLRQVGDSSGTATATALLE
jgi:DNA-binding Lrp family transcriptional regulator